MKLHQRLDNEAAAWWDNEPRPIDRLIAHYQPYAEVLADKAAARQKLVDADDYASAAMVALWECVVRFDPHDDRECAFSSFARTRILYAMTECERANDWVKPKVRSAAKRGEIKLPVMHSISPTDDAELAEEPEIDIASVMARCNAVERRWLEVMLDNDFDTDSCLRDERVNQTPTESSRSHWVNNIAKIIFGNLGGDFTSTQFTRTARKSA